MWGGRQVPGGWPRVRCWPTPSLQPSPLLTSQASAPWASWVGGWTTSWEAALYPWAACSPTQTACRWPGRPGTHVSSTRLRLLASLGHLCAQTLCPRQSHPADMRQGHSPGQLGCPLRKFHMTSGALCVLPSTRPVLPPFSVVTPSQRAQPAASACTPSAAAPLGPHTGAGAGVDRDGVGGRSGLEFRRPPGARRGPGSPPACDGQGHAPAASRTGFLLGEGPAPSSVLPFLSCAPILVGLWGRGARWARSVRGAGTRGGCPDGVQQSVGALPVSPVWRAACWAACVYVSLEP